MPKFREMSSIPSVGIFIGGGVNGMPDPHYCRALQSSKKGVTTGNG